MFLPLIFHSRIVVPNTPGSDASAILDRVETALRARDPRSLARHGLTLDFEGGFLRWIDRRNIFLSVRRGEVTLSATKRDVTVDYLLDFGGAYLIANAVAAALAAFLLPGLGRRAIWPRLAVFGILIVVAATLGPWATITRFTAIVREACTGVARPASVAGT